MLAVTVRKCGFVVTLVALAGILGVDAEPKEKSAAPKAKGKTCVVRFGGSAFPEPCDRLGEMPATAEPMHIIGILPRASK